MDELIDVLDDQGNYTGESILKSKAHKLGLFHPTVHIWCYSGNGKVLLQQRGANKDTHPLKWDVSVAGHVGSCEQLEIAAVREVHEEIGVTIAVSKLEKIGTFKIEERHSTVLFDREFTHTYLYKLDENTELTKQESEVEALDWVSLEKFEGMILEDEIRFVPNSKDRYKEVIKAIKSRL